MIRTYLDSNIVIAAYNISNPFHAAAFDLLRKSDRRFVGSRMLHLELLPYAAYHGRKDEAAFYDEFLREALVEVMILDEQMLSLALTVGARTNARAADALHLAAAISLGADEFVTTERRTKPMYRETRVRVVHLDDAVTA